IDFGLSKDFDSQNANQTRFFCDPSRYPERIWKQILELGKDDSLNLVKLRESIFPFADLYQFGLLIDDVLKTSAGAALDVRVSRYLRLLSDDLSRWEPASADRIATFSGRTRDARALREQLAKLAGGPQCLREGIAHRERRGPRIISRTR